MKVNAVVMQEIGYSVLMFLYGSSYSMMSFMIPYFVEKHSLQQSDIVWIFMLFGIGGTIGGFVFKIINTKLNAYQIQTLFCFMVALIDSMLFLFPNLYVIYACAILMAVSLCCLEIGANSCVLDTYGKQSQVYMQKFYGYYGFGLILLPIIISTLKYFALVFYSSAFVMICIIFFSITKSKKKGEFKKARKNSQNMQPSINGDVIAQIWIDEPLKPMPMKIKVWIYVNYFFATGSFLLFELFPSYGVVSKIFDKSTINIILTVALIFFTLGRLFYAWMKFHATKIINFCCVMLFASILISIFIHIIGLYEIYVITFPILVAISTAGIYPVVIAASKQRGINTSDNTLSNVSIVIAFSYLLNSTLLSGIINYIGPSMLFIGVGFFNFCIMVSLKLFDRAVDRVAGSQSQNYLKRHQKIQEQQNNQTSMQTKQTQSINKDENICQQITIRPINFISINTERQECSKIFVQEGSQVQNISIIQGAIIATA